MCCDSIITQDATITVLSAATGAPITDAAFSPNDLDYESTSADGGLDGVYSIDTLQGDYASSPISITVSAPGYVAQVVTGVATGVMSGCEPDPVCDFGGPVYATSSVVQLVPGDAGVGASFDASTDAPFDGPFEATFDAPTDASFDALQE